MNILRILQVLAVAAIAAVAISVWKPSLLRDAGKVVALPASGAGAAHTHVLDRAGIIPPQDLPRFEQYMGWIMRESGVDVRFVFLPGTRGKPIETLATELMDQLQIGGRTGQERGVLLLYDMEGQRLKVEVGYGLEGWFPDSFVSYLVQDHARLFFASGDISLGLRLMLRLLQHRIREAVIGNDFDPRTLQKARPLTHMSGGAGVSTRVPFAEGTGNALSAQTSGASAIQAANSPADAYYAYLEWLAHWPLDSGTDLLTPDSRGHVDSLRVSPAYAEFILLAEYGKSFRIVEREDVALLYFTGTPFVSPHFFVRQNGLWRLDLAAEVRNTREHVGGEYTWAYRGAGDVYSNTFADLLTTMKGYRRVRDGDNRPLLIRGS